MNDGFVSRQLKFFGDAQRLVGTISKEFYGPCSRFFLRMALYFLKQNGLNVPWKTSFQNLRTVYAYVTAYAEICESIGMWFALR